MKGKYTFKQNGVIVGEHENLITTAGRKAIIDYMAGYTQRIAGAILLGIGTTAATVADKSLAFEIFRVPVDLSSADYANNGVVFKGKIPAEREFTVYEAGVQTIYSSGQDSESQTLLDFNADADTWTVGTYSSTNSRLGQALQVTATASTTTTTSLSGLFYDLSGYSDADQFVFAYRANSAFVSSVVIRFKTDASNYYSLTVATPANGVYAITSVNKSALTVTGSPSWANITAVDILVTATAGGTASIDLDAVRIEDRDSAQEDNVLVSRSVLGSPVVKTVNVPLDVEYAITL
jgi:hypothetical protein